MKKSKKNYSKNKQANDPLAGDLSDFIREGIRAGDWKVAQFELKEPKNKVISLRLSEKLLGQVKKQAEALGIDTQKFIRIALESTIRK
jgi:predicted DNA binding CopG/RHH family protein